MLRRRKTEIKVSELACFDTLVEALRSRPEFADFDPARSASTKSEDAYCSATATSKQP